MCDDCGGGDLPERCDGEAVETSRTEADDSGARVAPPPRPHKKKAMLQNGTRGSKQREKDEEENERKDFMAEHVRAYDGKMGSSGSRQRQQQQQQQQPNPTQEPYTGQGMGNSRLRSVI